MPLKEQIKTDMQSSLKQGDDLVVSVLRMLNASIINKEKNKKEELTDEEIIDVIVSEVKKRKESATIYENGNRLDLAEKEKQEILVLQKYLPEQIPEEDLKKIIQDVIEKQQATEMKDMGKIMAELNPKIKGRADNSFVIKIIKELLGRWLKLII